MYFCHCLSVGYFTGQVRGGAGGLGEAGGGRAAGDSAGPRQDHCLSALESTAVPSPPCLTVQTLYPSFREPASQVILVRTVGK